jgi:hypothetical protein
MPLPSVSNPMPLIHSLITMYPRATSTSILRFRRTKTQGDATSMRNTSSPGSLPTFLVEIAPCLPGFWMDRHLLPPTSSSGSVTCAHCVFLAFRYENSHTQRHQTICTARWDLRNEHDLNQASSTSRHSTVSSDVEWIYRRSYIRAGNDVDSSSECSITISVAESPTCLIYCHQRR